jgi:hypothetical protein
MEYTKGFLVSLVFLLFACVMTPFGQNRNSIPPKSFPQMQIQRQEGTPKHPINIYFKNGTRVSADLVHNDPADPDAIVVETAGLRESIKLNDLIGIKEDPKKFDEYHAIAFNDEKARLDPFANQIHNDPTTSAYMVVYGTNPCEAQARVDRAKDYLVNIRGVDASRIVILSPGCHTEFSVELWMVPMGASAPLAQQTVTCRRCPGPPARGKTVSRRRSSRRQ